MRDSRTPVFLIGFMGAGKTTVGRALGRLLGWDFLDLDAVVVGEDGRSITRIFAEDGEAYFRGLEARALASLSGRIRLVIACGGGTYAHEPCRALIDQMGRAAWIHVPLSAALERCGENPARPLLKDSAQADALYRARLASYRLAPLHVDATGLGPDEVADRIARQL